MGVLCLLRAAVGWPALLHVIFEGRQRMGLVVALFLPLVAQAQFSYQQIKSFGFPELAASGPGPLIEGSAGALYGMAQAGGSNNLGIVFKVNKDGSAYALLHSFSGGPADGQYPSWALLEGSDGILYGTTQSGGSADSGVLFKLNTNGSAYTVLHHFLGGPTNGASPSGSLVEGPDGLLYGATYQGGSNDVGTVFKVNKNGSGYTLLRHFTDTGTNRAYSVTFLAMGIDGVLYGATVSGGTNDLGALFRLNRDGSGFSLLRSFSSSGGDGQYPSGPMIYGSDGVLYGMTYSGGTNNSGTVFKLNTNGTGYAVLRRFTGSPGDGASPQGSLLEGTDGALYGTTQIGGNTNAGSLFKMNKDGSGYTLLWNFPGGALGEMFPIGSLVEGSDGQLYGAANMLFKISKAGTGYTVLRRFNYLGGDGANPLSELTEGSDGLLYGTTRNGGSNDLGTLFRLSRSGSNYMILRNFAGADGASPYTALLEGSDGTLYGTTFYGGSTNRGTVFKVNKDGTGHAILHSFTGTGGDGFLPSGSLIEGTDGALYGTTPNGGVNNGGTIFKLNKNGSNYTVLRAFSVSGGAGYGLSSGVIEGSDGVLYGTVRNGGSNNFGSLFKMDKTGSNFVVLHSFAGIGSADGANPEGELIEASDGALYGTTIGGGMANMGSVFTLNKNGTGYAVLHSFTGGAADGASAKGALVETADGALQGTTYNGGGPAEAGSRVPAEQKWQRVSCPAQLYPK